MFRNKCRIITFFILLCFSSSNSQSVGLGAVNSNVPWKAGHASAYSYPYVIIYGGSKDTTSTTSTEGTNDLWVWDIRNGSWYEPTIQVQGGVAMLPQIYFKATTTSTQGDFIVLASNTTNGSTTNVIQKLDINSWSWSFPTSNLPSSSRTIGYTMLTLNNTVYTYGGIAVDSFGNPISGSIQNTLGFMDVNSYQWTSGSNGLGVAEHATCYLKSCNCLITFGGTSTGNPTDVTASVSIYSLSTRTWNVQGITATGSAPGARRLHTATCLDDSMLIYGGGTTQPIDSTLYVLNASAYPSFTWSQINTNNQSNGPGLRMGHSAVLDEANKQIFMYGGWGVSATNDTNMYILDMNTWSWTRVPSTGYPAGVTPTVNTTNPAQTNTLDNTKSSNAGTIAGAVVGAVAGLAIIIAALAFFLIRKRKKRQQIREKDTIVGEVIDDLSNHRNKDNPFTYNPGGYYSTNDDDDSDDDQAFYLTRNHNPKRMSKAFHGTQTSLARRSELGDSDKIITGVLEALDGQDNGTVAATNGSRSPHDSARNSKVLLVPPNDLVTQGQVPNEIVSQKPNQYSIPAARHAYNNHVPIEHHLDVNAPVSPLSATTQNSAFNNWNTAFAEKEAVLPSASVDVIRSIKTTGSSMMNHTGNSQLNESRKKDGIPVTHTIASKSADEDEEENWTFADSLSVNHHYTNDHTPPIQYITPSSNQLSVANSAQTWDTKDTNGQRQNPLVHHHHLQQQQYPSSTINMPMAQAVTPPTTTNNSSKNNSRNTNEMQDGVVNIYSAVSPLDALASFGQEQTTPGSSHHGSSSILNTKEVVSRRTTESASSDEYAQLAPLIASLPRKYHLDKSKSPITGPTNQILFAMTSDKSVAIKAFGRREAWERECRNLIKLKSDQVVEILEVLTIQEEDQRDDDENVRYVTVMERLDETLSLFIRHAKPTGVSNGSIARDIVMCLSWCHSNGIAFCDLKPSNIMHYRGGRWKLIDFEASRTIDEECVGVITPRYCPPEVARATTYGLEGANGVVATASVDLWSLGCVIYELETKKALFPSNIKDETILHFISHPSPSTPILNNGLRWNDNKELEIPQLEKHIPNVHTRQLIRTLLSREPSKRGSATQLLDDPYFSK